MTLEKAGGDPVSAALEACASPLSHRTGQGQEPRLCPETSITKISALVLSGRCNTRKTLPTKGKHFSDKVNWLNDLP